MTTVAYDGRYLAADTMAHRSGTPSNLLAPKIDMFDGFAYAVSGEWLAVIGRLIGWHQAGAVYDDFPKLDCKGGMMIVDLATRRMWIVSSEMHCPDEEAAPFTCGSGGDLALAAMDCDRNAMEAVLVASRRDVHTNDVIDFIDLEWPEKGVQRWDGHMPSHTLPMPLNVRDCYWAGEQDVTSWDGPSMSGVIMKAAGVKPQRINLDLGTLTRRFDEEDAPYFDKLYLPDHEQPTETYAFDELRATGTTAPEAGGDLTAKISNWLTGYPAGGTIMWRVRPYVELHYDITTDKAEWRGYCRLAVLPWARPKQRDTILMDDPNDNAGADREANVKEDMTRPKQQATDDNGIAIVNCDTLYDMMPCGRCDKCTSPKRKVMVMDGDRVIDCMFKQNECEPCGECWTCNRMGYGKPKSSTISLEELRRTFNDIPHTVLCAHEQQHVMAYGGVIGASDVCTHGYVRSTCATCKQNRTVAELLNGLEQDAKKAQTPA